MGRFSVSASVAMFALVGCAGTASVTPATPSLQASDESGTPSVDATETQTPRTLTFEITPMGTGDETPTGTVVVDVQGGGYMLTLNVEGLTPNGHYPVNLHAGHCPNPDVTAGTWVDQDIQADDTGTLTFQKEYAKPWEISEAGQVLTVHGRVPVAERTHIGCADLTE